MKIFSPLATLLMLASLTGFQAQAGSRQVIDANGQSQSVPDAPRRVVVLSELDLDSALTLGVQPVGTVNGRGQSTLPRYLLDKAGKEIAVVGEADRPRTRPHPHRPDQARAPGPAQGDRPYRRHRQLGRALENRVRSQRRRDEPGGRGQGVPHPV